MSVPSRFSVLPGLLLLVAAPLAVAQSPLPDPVAPAVVGRPLERIGSGRTGARRAAAAKQEAARRTAAATRVLGAAATTHRVATAHAPKQALDDRADTGPMLVNEVGVGTHFARKPLPPGVYFADRHRAAVRRYYQQHPFSGDGVEWQIGQPVPRGAALAPVPHRLLASLPKLPPGHRYVELGGEVVLIASGSKMVVDGISRAR